MALVTRGWHSLGSVTRPSDKYSRSRLSLEPAPVSRPPSRSRPTARQPPSNKWFKQPKIPVHMNMSTLIRMKSNETQRETSPKGNDQPVAVTDLSCSPKDPHMFDYMREKFETICKDGCNQQYAQDLLWKMAATAEGVSESANPSGDGFLENGTYHRMAAISVSDPRSGCNMQYIEKVSFESAPPATAPSKTVGSHDQGDVGTIGEFQNLSLAKESKVRHRGDERLENEVTTTRRKKISKHKKAVVVTSLKCSVKYRKS